MRGWGGVGGGAGGMLGGVRCEVGPPSPSCASVRWRVAPPPPPGGGVGGGGGKREVEMEAVHRDERNEQTTVVEVDEIEQI